MTTKKGNFKTSHGFATYEEFHQVVEHSRDMIDMLAADLTIEEKESYEDMEALVRGLAMDIDQVCKPGHNRDSALIGLSHVLVDALATFASEETKERVANYARANILKRLGEKAVAQ